MMTSSSSSRLTSRSRSSSSSQPQPLLHSQYPSPDDDDDDDDHPTTTKWNRRQHLRDLNRFIRKGKRMIQEWSLYRSDDVYHTHKNDDDSNDATNNAFAYKSNNNKRHRQRKIYQQKNAVVVFLSSLVLVLFLLLLLIMMSYQYYYYVNTYIYRPHYMNSQQQYDITTLRSQRFPTVQQRIQLYMSNWYIPPPPPPPTTTTTTTISLSSSNCYSTSSSSSSSSSKNTDHFNNTTTNLIHYSQEYTTTNENSNNDTIIKHYQLNHDMIVTNQVQIGTIFYTDIIQLRLCYKNTSYSIRYYCRDIMESILIISPYYIPLFLQRLLCQYDVLFYYVLIPYIHHINHHYNKNDKIPPPIMVQFSDETESWMYKSSSSSTSTSTLSNSYHFSNMDKVRNPMVPHIKKIRYALHQQDIDRIMSRTVHNDYSDTSVSYVPQHHCSLSSSSSTRRQLPPKPQLLTGMSELQPILWLLNENRHFKYTWDINRYDQSFATKKNMSVFRGMLTGPDIDRNKDDYTNCMLLPRCRLVYQTYDSIYVDAKITDTLNKLPDTIQDRNITGTHLWKEDILSYKGIIILEGNDVSSGLKWAMVSNSVVLMSPKITYSSWMMEELLQPYVHYIPIVIDPEYNNIEEQTIWMLQHESEVQRIIHRAKLWILDLYYHPDARRDMSAINAGILQQYQQYFVTS